jgi:hypothetical protein
MQKRDQIKTADAKWKSVSPCPRVIRPLLPGSRKDAKDSVSAFAVLPLVGFFYFLQSEEWWERKLYTQWSTASLRKTRTLKFSLEQKRLPIEIR